MSRDIGLSSFVCLTFCARYLRAEVSAVGVHGWRAKSPREYWMVSCRERICASA
jgi:hypothetical protein